MKSQLPTAHWKKRANLAHILSPILAGVLTLSAGLVCGSPLTPLLTSLEVSSNTNRIVIGTSGQVNRPTSFVMKRPHRLVLDFAETGFTKIPRRMKFKRGAIREIRCGRYKSKARVVIDFGSRPVPQYRVHERGNHVLVRLTGARRKPIPKRKTIKSAALEMDDIPKAVRSSTAQVNGNGPALRVGSVDIEDGLISVELCDKTKGSRCWRLVVEADVERMQVDRATISDVSGELRAFEMAPVAPTTRLAESRRPRPCDPKQMRGRGTQSSGLETTRRPHEPRVRTRGPRRLTSKGSGAASQKLALGP